MVYIVRQVELSVFLVLFNPARGWFQVMTDGAELYGWQDDGRIQAFCIV
jgi:hypothetical protein